MSTGLSKPDIVREDVTSVFDGARDGVRTDGSRPTEERRIDSSQAAKSLLTGAASDDVKKRKTLRLTLFKEVRMERARSILRVKDGKNQSKLVRCLNAYYILERECESLLINRRS
jgi:hypothetical protein